MTPVNKKTIVFFGDSITQAGVEKGGYIRQMQEYLEQQKKTADFDLIGAGIGGNKIYDLYLRMEDDVLARHPDAVVIYIGVNDVWHKTLLQTGTDADKFERFYTAIIKKLQAAKIETIICTPAVIGEKKANGNPLDQDLNKYSDIIRKIAVANSCKLIDLRNMFTRYDEQNNAANTHEGILTTDGVHLNMTGNAMVADAMKQALAL